MHAKFEAQDSPDRVVDARDMGSCCWPISHDRIDEVVRIDIGHDHDMSMPALIAEATQLLLYGPTGHEQAIPVAEADPVKAQLALEQRGHRIRINRLRPRTFHYDSKRNKIS